MHVCVWVCACEWRRASVEAVELELWVAVSWVLDCTLVL